MSTGFRHPLGFDICRRHMCTAILWKFLSVFHPGWILYFKGEIQVLCDFLLSWAGLGDMAKVHHA